MGKIRRILNSKICYNNTEDALRKMIGFLSDSDIPGDYLEFGVFKGDSLKSAIEFVDEFKIKDINFYGFDTFKGMPKPSEEDRGLIGENDYKYPLEKVRKRISSPKVKLIKGLFNEIKLPKEINVAAIINIDCDYYSSTRDVLKLVKPLLQEGTLIRFDDWSLYKCKPDKGQQKAFNEFKQCLDEFYFIEWYNSGLSKVFLTLRK